MKTDAAIKTQVATVPQTRVVAPRSLFFLSGYGVVYFALLFSMHRFEGFDLSEPLLVLGLIGVSFSAFAWWVTRNSVPLPFAVKQPARETILLLICILPLIAYLTWGRNALALSTIPKPRQSVVILVIKILLCVAIPAATLILACGYRWRELFVVQDASRHVWPALWMSLAIVAFQCVAGRGLGEIRHSGLTPLTLIVGAPLIYLFLLLEVGLVEEFFFRVLLQSRLAAWLKSEVGGIVGMALLFGLMHAPGLYYRSATTQEALGLHPSWLMAIGYSVVITSVTGFFLGVLWMRTRNLPLLMAIHAAGDLVPNLVPMLKNWI